MKTVFKYIMFLLLVIVLIVQSAIAYDFEELETRANQGDAEAMYELGGMYERGLGIIQNYILAHKWYNIAASMGHVKALRARDAIAGKMIAEQLAEAQKLALEWKPYTDKVTEAEIKTKDKSESLIQELFTAVHYGDADKLKVLLDSGVDPNTEIFKGVPILMVAVNENQKSIIEILVNAGADVNVKLLKGMTLLMVSIRDGHSDIAKYLIENGANLDAESDNGFTAISLARSAGMEGIVRLIKKAGVKDRPEEERINEDILEASEDGNLEKIKKLLVRGTNPNRTDKNGWSPLMYAVSGGHKEIVVELIKAGADINIKADDGSTALMIAKRQGYEKIAELLKIKLRSSYKDLTYDQVKAVLKKYNFYDHLRGKTGELSNYYEVKMIGGDKVVEDHATGLMWHQSGSEECMKWEDAKEWVDSFNRIRYAGFDGWRLPTVEEAASLLESSENDEYLYIDPIFSKKQRFIWTGDSYGSRGAWNVNFSTGGVIWCFNVFNLYVRPVRSVK